MLVNVTCPQKREEVKALVKFTLDKFNDHLSATLACKASIKANTDLSINEMEVLINDLPHIEEVLKSVSIDLKEKNIDFNGKH